MKIQDRIWGDIEADEPVIEELINSPPMKRLRGIAQFGLPDEYYHLAGFSRYEHSVGVFALLRKLGASLEEQVAGLLHDISHTAFSHLFDWVIENRAREDYQDLRHEVMFQSTIIPLILKKYGLNSEKVSQLEKHALLDRPIPELCADRIDYSLREFFDWADPAAGELCRKQLRNYQGKIIFESKDAAQAFAYTFLKLQREHWGSVDKVVRWQIFAEMLKRAMRKGIVMLEDFDRDDEYILEKLKKSKDDSVHQTLEMLKVELEYDGIQPLYSIQKKFRYVDPHYTEGNRILRLSDADADFRGHLEEERKHNKRGVPVCAVCRLVTYYTS